MTWVLGKLIGLPRKSMAEWLVDHRLKSAAPEFVKDSLIPPIYAKDVPLCPLGSHDQIGFLSIVLTWITYMNSNARK